jgi:hypothetical protein
MAWLKFIGQTFHFNVKIEIFRSSGIDNVGMIESCGQRRFKKLDGLFRVERAQGSQKFENLIKTS